MVAEKRTLRIDDKIRRSIRKERREEGFNEDIEEGSKETSISIIKSLLENNINQELIAKATNKSISEIEQIKLSMQK